MSFSTPKDILKIPSDKRIQEVCYPCGITANYLTCLEKFGRPPLKACFDVNTVTKGRCDLCGHEDTVTAVRDFFYPNFSLIIKFLNQNK